MCATIPLVPFRYHRSSGVTRPEKKKKKKTGPLAEFPPPFSPTHPAGVHCRGATIARSLPLARVILPFVIEYYKLIL